MREESCVCCLSADEREKDSERACNSGNAILSSPRSLHHVIIIQRIFLPLTHSADILVVLLLFLISLFLMYETKLLKF